MGSLSSGLDETHCLSVMCPHPCCWETEQRILKGIPRQVKTKSFSADSSDASLPVDEFPTLSVVNAAEWTSDISLHAPVSLTASNEKHVPEQRCSEDAVFSVENPATRSLCENKREIKVVKLGTVEINGTSSCNTSLTHGTVMIWVPGHVQNVRSQNSSRSSQVSVQKLICLPKPSESLKIAQKNRKKPQGVKKRVQFYCTPSPSQNCMERVDSQMTPEAIDQVPSSLFKAALNSSMQGKESKGPAQNQELPARGTSRPSRPGSQLLSVAALQNKPVVFHSIRERMRRCNSQQSQPAYMYKLDPETKPDCIDWDSLKRQTYLWMKHHLSTYADKGEASSTQGACVNPPGLQVDSLDLCPAPKATLQYNPQISLSKGSVEWHCSNSVEERCPSQGSALPFVFKPRNSVRQLCNTPNLQGNKHLDIDAIASRYKRSGTITPMHSLSYAARMQHRIDEDPQFALGRERTPMGGVQHVVSRTSTDVSTETARLQPSPPPPNLNSEIWKEGTRPMHSH